METVLSIMVLAVLGLPIAAWLMWRKGDRRQAMLMAVLALVAAVNVAIWTLPDASGTSPVAQELRK
ncbi:hypothetical protein [Novosphingobium sp.]|jgi:Na+/proline symporter|uniref:hypothetical protein n=1 Tax=Novosphingobium sp. TaxID=1874826 RepID=UPI0035B40B9B